MSSAFKYSINYTLTLCTYPIKRYTLIQLNIHAQIMKVECNTTKKTKQKKITFNQKSYFVIGRSYKNITNIFPQRTFFFHKLLEQKHKACFKIWQLCFT